MSVDENIQQGLRALESANSERAWAAVGALVAIIGVSFAVSLAVVLALPGPIIATLFSVAAAVGSIIGAASLVFFALPATSEGSIRPHAYGGLWIGNLVAAGFVAWAPTLLIRAAIPNLSGFMLVRRYSPGLAPLYIALPYVALAVTTVIGHEFATL